MFSLLHELCHLLVHENGLSKFEHSYIEQLPNSVRKLERLCNALAAEILIPLVDFAAQSRNLPQKIEDAQSEVIAQLANRYGVSRNPAPISGSKQG